MKTKGFTLVELIIVIVIVSILSIVAIPMYRGYVRKAMLTEGKTLISSIEKQENIYYAEFARYLPLTSSNIFVGGTIDILLTANKYFREFEVANITDAGFVIVVRGTGAASGITLTLTSDNITNHSTLDVDDITEPNI